MSSENPIDIGTSEALQATAGGRVVALARPARGRRAEGDAA